MSRRKQQQRLSQWVRKWRFLQGSSVWHTPQEPHWSNNYKRLNGPQNFLATRRTQEDMETSQCLKRIQCIEIAQPGLAGVHTTRIWVLRPALTEFILQDILEIVFKTEIKPCAHSDHDIVSTFLMFRETPRRKGVWHLNCKILHSNAFKNAVLAFWPAWHEGKKNSLPSHSDGDDGKRKTKILAESFSKQIKQETNVELHKKVRQLRNMQNKADRTRDTRHARLALDLWNDIKILTITPEQKEALSAAISKRKILPVISSMANGKLPGSGGLMPEIYKSFEHLLADNLLKVYGDMFWNERMSSTQRLGLIRLSWPDILDFVTDFCTKARLHV